MALTPFLQIGATEAHVSYSIIMAGRILKATKWLFVFSNSLRILPLDYCERLSMPFALKKDSYHQSCEN